MCARGETMHQYFLGILCPRLQPSVFLAVVQVALAHNLDPLASHMKGNSLRSFDYRPDGNQGTWTTMPTNPLSRVLGPEAKGTLG
ncbi:hypothetical protein V8C26DRAFT_399471 [Trichoderma gracile]